MAESSKRKFRIFQDEVKLRHTSHWDMDTMSRAELEAYMDGDSDPRTTAGKTTPGVPPVRAADNAWSRFLRACLPGR